MHNVSKAHDGQSPRRHGHAHVERAARSQLPVQNRQWSFLNGQSCVTHPCASRTLQMAKRAKLKCRICDKNSQRLGKAQTSLWPSTQPHCPFGESMLANNHFYFATQSHSTCMCQKHQHSIKMCKLPSAIPQTHSFLRPI